MRGPRTNGEAPHPAVLLIFPETPRGSAAGLDVVRSLERLAIPAVCFSARMDASSNGAASALRSDRVRWAEDDPELRWLALKSILNHANFQAVGYIGVGPLREYSERIDDYAHLPGFLHLTERDLPTFLTERGWRLRGVRNLRLVLFSRGAVLRQMELRIPGALPFRVAALDCDKVWPPLLRRPRGAGRAPASLITPVYNRLQYTARCVESVLAKTPAPFEWFIVDNGSTDGTRSMLERLARRDRRIRYIRNDRNLGFARAVNQGLRKARGKTLILLNNDTIVPPGWLEGLVSCLDRDPGLGAVGPCTNQGADVPQHQNASYDLGRFDAFATAWSLKHSGGMRQVHRLIGFCLAVRRAAYEQAGLLDERFDVGGYEDYDYCLRLRQAGWRLALTEDVFVHHYGHVSYGNSAAWGNRIMANREIFLDKWTRKSLEFLDNLWDLRLPRARDPKVKFSPAQACGRD